MGVDMLTNEELNAILAIANRLVDIPDEARSKEDNFALDMITNIILDHDAIDFPTD